MTKKPTQPFCQTQMTPRGMAYPAAATRPTMSPENEAIFRTAMGDCVTSGNKEPQKRPGQATGE